jgi:hypothetical protein
MNAIQSTTARALAMLDASGNRSDYAREVIQGARMWSGNDLRGKAKKWASGYYRQRCAALTAWKRVGGVQVYAGPTGELVGAVIVGTDEWGNALYATAQHGVCVARNGLGRVYPVEA